MPGPFLAPLSSTQRCNLCVSTLALPSCSLVGALMVRNILSIRWDLVQDAVPAFLTICLMPLTYSVAYGEFADSSRSDRGDACICQVAAA